jgi:hypothetical protein
LDLVAPQNVITPQQPVQPVEGLEIIHGYRCVYEGCSELRGTKTSVKQHCWESHRWKAKTGNMWEDQDCQTFFDGSRHKYICLNIR